MSKPEPPPEAVLLRLARMASGIRTPVAAAAAGISKARLSQIENGYEKRAGQYRPVSGSDAVIAHLAAVCRVTPAELDEAGRPVAASVLRIILERQAASAAAEAGEVADLPPAGMPEHLRKYWRNPVIGPAIRKLWGLDITRDQKLVLTEELVRILGNDGSGSGASAVGDP